MMATIERYHYTIGSHYKHQVSEDSLSVLICFHGIQFSHLFGNLFTKRLHLETISHHTTPSCDPGPHPPPPASSGLRCSDQEVRRASLGPERTWMIW